MDLIQLSQIQTKNIETHTVKSKLLNQIARILII